MRNIIEQLQKFTLLDDLKVGEFQNYKNYKTKNGYTTSIGLMNNREVSVAVTELAAGDEFLKHKHPEYEIIIIIKGEGLAIVDTKQIEYAKNKIIKIEPETYHRLYAKTDTKFIVVLIPGSHSFPRGAYGVE